MADLQYHAKPSNSKGGRVPNVEWEQVVNPPSAVPVAMVSCVSFLFWASIVVGLLVYVLLH